MGKDGEIRFSEVGLGALLDSCIHHTVEGVVRLTHEDGLALALAHADAWACELEWYY